MSVRVPAMYKVGTEDWLSVCYSASDVKFCEIGCNHENSA